jgi:hypothetical protein
VVEHTVIPATQVAVNRRISVHVHPGQKESDLISSINLVYAYNSHIERVVGKRIVVQDRL